MIQVRCWQSTESSHLALFALAGRCGCQSLDPPSFPRFASQTGFEAWLLASVAALLALPRPSASGFSKTACVRPL